MMFVYQSPDVQLFLKINEEDLTYKNIILKESSSVVTEYVFQLCEKILDFYIILKIWLWACQFKRHLSLGAIISYMYKSREGPLCLHPLCICWVLW